MGIFRKQQFKCAGCGKTVVAKITVPVEKATLPVAPPPDWGGYDIIAQHPDTGGIGSLTVFTCGPTCFAAVQADGGVGKGYIDSFKATFAPGAPTTTVAPAAAGEPPAETAAEADPT